MPPRGADASMVRPFDDFPRQLGVVLRAKPHRRGPLVEAAVFRTIRRVVVEAELCSIARRSMGLSSPNSIAEVEVFGHPGLVADFDALVDPAVAGVTEGPVFAAGRSGVVRNHVGAAAAQRRLGRGRVRGLGERRPPRFAAGVEHPFVFDEDLFAVVFRGTGGQVRNRGFPFHAFQHDRIAARGEKNGGHQPNGRADGESRSVVPRHNPNIP